MAGCRVDSANPDAAPVSAPAGPTPIAALPQSAQPSARVIEIGPGDDFETLANTLGPGDQLILDDGVYLFDERVAISATGSARRPAVIYAKPGAQPVIEQKTQNHNIIEIVDAAHLVIRGLTFRKGSQGVRLIRSSFITIEDCEIYATGDVALSANTGTGTFEGLQILRNHIHHTNGHGEGIYLGCHDDTCRVANSIIEANYVHHTNGPSVTQGDGIEIKKGSYGNTVRNNVVHDTRYPAILLYGTNGNGARNIVEGNVMWNVQDNTMQVAADAEIRNNIILGNVAMQPHHGVLPGNILFVHNTVISPTNAIKLYQVSDQIIIANNALYAPQGFAVRVVNGDFDQVRMSGNAGTGQLSNVSGGFRASADPGRDFINARAPGAPPVDLYPTPGSILIGAADPRYAAAIDFNGTRRSGTPVAGAYHFSPGGNPGWAIAAEPKRLVSRPRGPAGSR